MNGTPQNFAFEWRGIAIHLTYDAAWLQMREYAIAHLEVRSEPRLPLPFTETGYRSLFCHPAEIEAEGGPAEFVAAWLNAAAADPAWHLSEEQGRQLSLF